MTKNFIWALLVFYIIGCIFINAWAINMAFMQKPWDAEEVIANSEKPWRQPARWAFASIVIVGSLTSIGYIAIRVRNWND
jgi:hypothetical protein